jgi:hypothetical protein
MNLTLNEKLRFQKQAGIINESQYKKLLKENQDNYLDGVDGREFEKKEIKDWFRTMDSIFILVNDNGKEYETEFTDLNSALKFIDNLPETAQVMI